MKYKDISLATEEAILRHWNNNETVQFLRDRDAEGEKFCFLEGPPYTSGKIHMGHAWNMALKDMVLRYKRANGFNVWDRMGYDMHGLPTEQKTMKRHGLKDKEDIEKFGLLRFRQECEKFCLEMKEQMDKDFVRLGATLDFRDSYQPIKNEYIESVWHLVSSAHKKGRLYQGLRTMHWDFATQSSVAKHELEYKEIKDTSIYVKFPRLSISGEALPGKYFVIWTTTPWTIPLNLAIMVNPDIDYLEAQVLLEDGSSEKWVVAKNLLESVLEKAKISSHTIVSEFKGLAIAGEKYEHPLGTRDMLPEELQQNPKLFTVLLTKKYCDDSSGTGLVHSAPGCGPEDYEVGHLNGIPPFNPINEAGHFANFGKFNGIRAKIEDKKFVEIIDSAGVLVAKQSYVHDYPHGERSHEPVIFRTTKQWFFKIEDLKEKLLAWNEQVHWVPEAGKNAFRNWLENLRDNSISKQRFWGTPVPIWKWTSEDGEEEDFIVIESIAQLEELSGVNRSELDLHIPAIDRVVIVRDGKEYRRVPDVLDVWIDAGSAAFAVFDYPSRKDLLEKYYPADFILEGKDQIRGWFNLLMVAAALGIEKMPFKACFMHGFVTDVDGVKMSKSLGNVISPYEVIDKHSVDVLRSYMCRASAGEDVNFSWDELIVAERRVKIMWNLHKLLLNLSIEVGQNPFELDKEITLSLCSLEEKYILSYLQSAIKEITLRMENYELDKVPELIDDLFLEISRTYIQMVREKSSVGSSEEKEVVLYVLAHVLFEGLKVAQIVMPYASEAMYLNLKQAYDLEEESISHFMWPKADEKLVDEKLVASMGVVSSVIQSGLNAREKAKLGLRWPIKELIVVSLDSEVISSVESLRDILKAQLNVKDISILSSLPGVKESVKPNYRTLGPKFQKQSSEVITKLTVTSSEAILTNLNSKGVHEVVLDSGETVTVVRADFEISREVPVGFSEAEFKDGYVYLNLERNLELDAEGYAREIMRYMQNARKKSGFQKADQIFLHVTCPGDLGEAVSVWSDSIAAKVGASKVYVGSLEFPRAFKEQETFSVKGKEFSVGYEKV